MNRKLLILRNLAIIIVLSILLMFRLGLYLSPIAAHKSSERGIHYGPSEIIHIEDFEKGKYILGKYDRWISCNTVNRFLYIFWTAGNQPTGIENDTTKAVCYDWSSGHPYFKAYGVINDNKIKKIEVTLSNGVVITQDVFFEDMFLVKWKENKSNPLYFKGIRGYDKDNNIIFEE